MSLLKTCIDEKKFDIRLVDKNLVRGSVTDAELKKAIQELPDDGENAQFISLDEIEDQV